jgi:hypothetical protein
MTDVDKESMSSRKYAHWWRGTDLLSVLAVILACSLIYGVPTIALDQVGKPVSAEWKQKLEIPKESSRSELFRCITPDGMPSQDASKASSRSNVQGRVAPLEEAPFCRQITSSERAALDSAEDALVLRGDLHLEVARKFFEWQYLATLAGLVSATLTAAALLMISLQGLPASAMWSKALFVVCSASSAFWIAVPQLYRYSANQSSALKGYTVASETVGRIRVVRATGRDTNGQWIDGSKFVGVVAQRVAEVNAFGVAFDESKVVPQKLSMPSE